MKANQIPIKSTWRDALGVPLTDRRITKRIAEGWYGRIAQLHQQAKSADKAKRKKAKEELKRYEGQAIKGKTLRITGRPINIEDFC
jgi:phosphoglycerate dehydrogenase-like enzyme